MLNNLFLYKFCLQVFFKSSTAVLLFCLQTLCILYIADVYKYCDSFINTLWFNIFVISPNLIYNIINAQALLNLWVIMDYSTLG